MQSLSSQALQTRASLDALKKEQAALDELREQLRQAQTEVRESTERTETLKGEFEQLRVLSDAARAGCHPASRTCRARPTTRRTRPSRWSRTSRRSSGPLAQLQEMSKTTEERMTTLNALAEHVNQKIKALENQKHTVEHAVVESNRLNEMIWAMEVQINKLNEGARQATRTEELIERVEKLSREVTGQLDTGAKARDSFAPGSRASSRRTARR